jgi:hypothetical protein
MAANRGGSRSSGYQDFASPSILFHKQSVFAQDPAKYSCRCFLRLMLIPKKSR